MINRVKDWEDMTIDEMLELYKNNNTITERLLRTKKFLIDCSMEHTTLRERRCIIQAAENMSRKKHAPL